MYYQNKLGVVLGMSNLIFILAYCEAFFLYKPSLVVSINPNLVLGISIIIGVLILVLVLLLIRGIRQEKRSSTLPEKSPKDKTKKDKTSEEIPGKTPDDAQKQPIEKTIDYSDKLIQINDELESFGFAYDPEGDYFYSTMNSWQRDFGYCQLYDETAPTLSMIIDCEPIYFDYAGKRWLIEFWKGQYGITTGAEVGIYNTEKRGINIPGVFQGTFYHAVKDEERLEMAFTLVKNDQTIIRRKELHWWLTGFKLGEFSYPNELKMYIEIGFKDPAMRSAFVEGLVRAGYTREEFSERNNIVYIVFDVPHTRQPYSRSPLVENIMQENNSRNVELFNNTTKAFVNIIDKLYSLRQSQPDYYKNVLSIGKPKQLFDVYSTIKSYTGWD